MAAKLEWDGSSLLLGGFQLAQVYGPTKDTGTWDYVVNDVTTAAPSKQYESEADCRQDCESEVRRLLKEAGVEIEG